ncbi:MAG: hypothetical protein ACE15C_19770 [Phycisphaerae bacterium]
MDAAQARYERKVMARSVERCLRLRMAPQDAMAAKLLRYETTLSNQFYRAVHELQRLQAIRLGAPVYPARIPQPR